MRPSEGAAIRTGEVVAVSYSAELINGVGKEPHQEGEVTQWGIPGDRHYGETRYSSSARKTVPNNRPITVVGAGATRDSAEKLGIDPIPPGGLGENILLEGLGDLSNLQEGDRLRFYASGEEEPSVENEPCANLRIYHRLMPKELIGKRGVICTVLKEGTVRVGDKAEVIPVTPEAAASRPATSAEEYDL
jgi:MOSC domain-containing protein YiiM